MDCLNQKQICSRESIPNTALAVRGFRMPDIDEVELVGQTADLSA